MTQQNWTDSDCFYVIKSISVNFNNAAGLLSNATQQDLYRMSAENGSNQSWYEFSGKASVYAGANQAADLQVPTSGSHLVLEFGKDIQLTEDFYSSGSIGQFSLQMDLEVESQFGVTVSNDDFEIVVVTMQSGAFVCERGTSSTYTAMLTKQLVLDANKEKPHSESEVRRIVGGGFLDSLKSASGKIAKYAPVVGKLACSVLGSGESGGGMSGGGITGGGSNKGKKVKHPMDYRM